MVEPKWRLAKRDLASPENWIMYHVYALRNIQNNDLYIGYTQDLRKRFYEHNSGSVKATKGCKPWEIVYYEGYASKRDATKREAQLKKNHRLKEDLKIQIKYSFKPIEL